MKKITAITCTLLLLAGCKGGETGVWYQTTPANYSTISKSITATGTVEPVKTVTVGTQVSGIIDKIYVDYNSVVKEGDLIAEIDRSVLQQELSSAKASLASAETEMNYQKTLLDRYAGLYEKGLISCEAYETYKYNYDRAKASYNQSYSNYTKAEKNMGYSWIYSPVDGVVLTREVDEGQTVASGFSTPTLFTIANDLTAMRVIVDVDEADIGQVSEGQSATFEVDAYPDETFSGTVTQVRLNATVTSNVVTYEVVVDAPNPELKLKPGLTANVTIYTVNKENVLVVPVRALRFTVDDYSGEVPDECVWTLDSQGKPAPVAVTCGDTDGVYTEITAGLGSGDKVITGISLQQKKEADSGARSGSNPFMPKRPDQGNNVRTK